jgi:hypothetical protein
LFLLRRNSWRKRLEDKVWKVGTAREFLKRKELAKVIAGPQFDKKAA